jgi:hypothetical protein
VASDGDAIDGGGDVGEAALRSSAAAATYTGRVGEGLSTATAKKIGRK